VSQAIEYLTSKHKVLSSNPSTTGKKTNRMLTTVSGTQKMLYQLGVVVHICNPSRQEGEAGGLTLQSHPGLHRETPSQNARKKKKKRER
jgi:hypothetical protein